MGWEWRYFARRALPADGAKFLAGHREDVYFPGTASVGMKLRDGGGSLEVKVRSDQSEPSDLPPSCGTAEKWKKSMYEGCVKRGKGEAPRLDGDRCAAVTGMSATELFGEGAQPLPVRVHCRKDREHTATGERTDTVFLAFLDGVEEPVLVERYLSVSVECRVREMREQLAGMSLPPDAWIGGYPGIVVDIARRARLTRSA
eukprot:TRINITY_DN16885_c0_g1_i1.p1 TRINITY_DN16885_c0_g1~~TRINITY_DN16885_c0_g1_i1.p1  ORF type:complete len:217 (+),score=60.70 TRINITY_DN16885_c0_g1_i1:50-652(+)